MIRLTTPLLRTVYREMQPGTAFLLTTMEQRDHALHVARRYGFKAKSRKINGKGYQIQLCERD